MNTFISAVLVGLVGVFCMWDSRLLGRLNFEQPLVGATLVGLLLGDVPTGLAVGAAVELVSMGLVQVGAAVPPDMVLGGIVAAAFACLTDASAETAMTIAIPVAVLGQLLGIVFRSIIAALTHVADSAIDNGKFKTAYRMHICAGSGLYAVMYFLPIFLAVFVGTDLVQAIVNMVPEWLSTGLNVSTKIMTAYGLALLLTMMIKKGMTPFLFIGFLLAAYLNLSVIAVALIGVCRLSSSWASSSTVPMQLPVSIPTTIRSKTTKTKEEHTMATATKDVSLNKKVSQFFWRSGPSEASWNYERQMNMGFLYGMVPTLDRLYPDESDPKQLAAKKEAYHRHMAFYNCTPQTSAFILGLSASMEEEYARIPRTSIPIRSTRSRPPSWVRFPASVTPSSRAPSALSPLASGVQLAQQGSIMGPILAMLISIVPSVLITWFAAKMGYQGGHEYLSKLQGGDLMEKLMYVCGIVGLMSVGGMIATLIGATTPLQFADGAVVIQDILDGMMPQMISLGLTGLMYWLIKKNVNTGWLLVIAIVGGIALSAAGILA